MTIPIEFLVKGKPSSVNSTSVKKHAWKAKVTAAANAQLAANFGGGPIPAAHAGDVTVKVFFFPHTQQYLDVDNGLKHTIDAFSPPVIANDKTVTRLVAERFAPIPGASLTVPVGIAATLVTALMTASGQASVAAGGAFNPEFSTAVKVESYIFDNGAHW
ncbi:hypothetical protein ACS0ZG_31925 [Burkholderia gladioli]|uniref:hypothetical protein n=1 Tax=Burkholderia gladioli TaxID=28095 RepID=UPI003F7A3523